MQKVSRPAEEPAPSFIPEPPPAADTGLAALVLLLAFHDIPADPITLTREYAPNGDHLGALAIVRASRAKGLKARKTRTKPSRVGKLPLPAIAIDREGKFFILAKAVNGSVLIKANLSQTDSRSLPCRTDQRLSRSMSAASVRKPSHRSVRTREADHRYSTRDRRAP